MKHTGAKVVIYIILIAASLVALFPFVWCGQTFSLDSLCCIVWLQLSREPLCDGLCTCSVFPDGHVHRIRLIKSKFRRDFCEIVFNPLNW